MASPVSDLHGILMWIDLINIAGSYLAFASMGWRGFTGHERTRLKRRWVLLTPLYWLLMSVAGWRALGQLASNAHLWEKTPHPAAPEWAAVAEASEQPCEKSGNGAGEGNRTLVLSLGSFCSTIELHPPAPVILGGVEQPCQAGSIRKAA
jgi:hypothetical protein